MGSAASPPTRPFGWPAISALCPHFGSTCNRRTPSESPSARPRHKLTATYTPSMLLPEKMWGRMASCAAVGNRRCHSMASPVVHGGELFRNSAVDGRIGHVPGSQFLLQPVTPYRFQALLDRAADQFATAGADFGGSAFGFPEKQRGKVDHDFSGTGCGCTLSGSSHILFS